MECDWMARAADRWDAVLSKREQQRHHSAQALRDALKLRDLIFAEPPMLDRALVRGFRPSAPREPPELFLAGNFSRECLGALRVSSLVMKAKLAGLHFEWDDGILQALELQPAFEGQAVTD